MNGDFSPVLRPTLLQTNPLNAHPLLQTCSRLDFHSTLVVLRCSKFPVTAELEDDKFVLPKLLRVCLVVVNETQINVTATIRVSEAATKGRRQHCQLAAEYL